MATAPGRASMSTGNTTSFGQFHQIQSHDPPAEPPNATLTDQNQMLRNSRPSIGPNNLDPRAQTTANHTPNQTTAPSANFGQVELVELSATSTPEGVLGPNKDGRVRNPVPSKLKGKTDGKDGAFGVMHMDLSNGKKSDMAGKDVAAERDAAARRTSEKTASAAKAAQQSGYVPPRKRRIGGEEEQDEKPRPGRPLAPDETKYEQARLLTLLRSINPVTVVDQLCKAVAYFGGIPGAPPPEDGIFPESANTRETGALFIGWLSEIFPDLSKAPSPEITRLHEAPKRSRGRPRKENGMPHDSVTPTNDTQGPPQGHAQAQQGQKPQVARPSWGQLPPPVMKSPEDTWGAPNEVAAQPEYVAPQTNPPQMDSTNDMEDEPADALDLFNHIQGQKPSTPNNLQSVNTYSTNAHSGSNSTSKRGRGRPKGSRNKKLEEQQEEEARARQNDAQNGIQQNTAEVQGQQPSTQQGAGSTSATSNSGQNTEEEQRTLIAQQQNLLFGKSLWGGQNQNGQPQKPSGTSHLDNLSVEEQAVVTAFRNQRPPGPSTTITNTTAISTPSGAGAKRKRPAPAQNNQSAQTFQGQQSVAVTPQAPLSNKPNDNPTNMAKEALQWDQMANTGTSTTTPATTSMTKDALQWDQLAPTSTPTTVPAQTKLAKDTLQWGSVTPSSVAPTPVAPTPVAPPAKRQRKPKDPNAPPAKRKTASISSSKATPPTIPSTIPDSQATASSQSISQQNASQQGPSQQGISQQGISQQGMSQQGMSQPNIPQKSIPQQSIPQQSIPRPPAEGLEAHYERFANLQQNSRSHTPTVPQRQNTNTTSAAPQRQHTPSQSLQQAQKQRQQQAPQPQPQPADKTVEQIMSQTSSTASGTRPSSSNTFYNQTRYTPGQFSQQYPSHQPSQQYGSTQSQSQSQSQVSPRVSNSASNNSYRSGSTNTLARASPQFSQSQGHSNYRTASPHPLSQPSPSFSTADTSNFRAANPHSVSQTSPLYSPRTSQTQSSQQSHQSHYNHFPSSSYIDLPTLESLDHSGSGIGASSTVGLNTATYGQGLGVNRNTGTYGSSSGLNNAFDTGVRVSQSGNSHSGYGSTSGINNAFDSTGTSEQDMRERLLGLGRR